MKKHKHIAVIIPVNYTGGSLRGAKRLAETLLVGSRLCGESITVTLAHLDDEHFYPDSEFIDMHPDVSRRVYEWKILDSASARRALAYSGSSEQVVQEQSYCVPDDGINQFLDCDLWLIISDRLSLPLLPIRPYVLMVYDYIQRYIPFLSQELELAYFDAARKANAVLVTTEFTREDATQYAGIPPERVHKLPMLVPVFQKTVLSETHKNHTYFVYATNTGAHKNLEHAFLALKIYYDDLGGTLCCHITGFNTENLLSNDANYPYLQKVARIYQSSPMMKKKITLCGMLSDVVYQKKLQAARYLLHAGAIDNGTFCVIEAALLGVPSLSSDYPAMREIATEFDLNVTWMNPNDPKNMAEQLKWMETHSAQLSHSLRSYQPVDLKSMNDNAIEYWKVVQSCL